MTETPALKPCPLCHSPHTNVARNLKGDVEQGFCKVCGCSAPIAAWNKRSVGSAPKPDEGGTWTGQCAHCAARFQTRWELENHELEHLA